eukprot:CAMPEP_0184747194 /NCGR_PEP_ID=MMETSP0315-20130426/9539_1 /TAXON_ID=101924 /ORGANISM="Rhodosorus marinus, Strain UTEX LB 2760" /LENGTH=681 /DNA_ID=CAMNT_0027219965 /DNA_START=421 /DNA_END=2466 /DNA_ORIENTATION=-
MDRRGDNLTLEALDEDLTDTNKGEMILRIVQQKIWKPRWVVGRRWYRTVWSWGDLIVTFILLSANLIWALAHFLKVYYERRPLYGVIYDTDKDMRIGVAYSWAYFLAWGGMMDAGATILFTLREDYLTRTVMGPEGGEYFHGIKYHIGLGYLTFAILTIHSFYIGGVELYFTDGDVWRTFNPASGYNGHVNFWGVLAWCFLAVMVVTSLWAVRRWNYRIFYWGHQFYILFVFAAAVHWQTAIYPVVGALLFFTYDRIVPYLNFNRGVVGKITRVAEEIIRVDVPLQRAVNMEYAPGDWINLRIPHVNLVSFHPFSIGSFYRTSPSHATVFVKARGSWTHKLQAKSPELGETVSMKMHVEGPFGVRQKTYLHSAEFAIIGAGTGITAVLPYAFQYSLVHPERKVAVVWIARWVEEMACYPELYAMCQYLESNNNFEIKLHLTREESGRSQQIEMETVESSSPPPARSSPSEVSADGSGGRVGIDSQEDEEVDSSENVSSEGDLKHAEKVKSKSALIGYGAAVAMVVAVFGIGIFSFFWPRAAFQTGLDREELDCYHWNPDDITSLSGYQMFMCFYVQAMTMTISILMAAIAGGVVVLLYPVVVERRSGWKNFHPPKPLPRRKVNTPWVVGRPEFEKLIGSIAESGAESVGLMVAGPERMVLQLDQLCLKQRKLEFFRESWKV